MKRRTISQRVVIRQSEKILRDLLQGDPDAIEDLIDDYVREINEWLDSMNKLN